MEMSRRRNIVSALVIVAMVASIFTLPLLNDDYVVNAAAKKVKVTFKANGGKFTAKKYAKKKAYSKKIKKDKKIGKLPKVKRTDYKFKGWYTKKSGGKKVTKSTKIKKKTTLYARWEKKEQVVTVTLNPDTGKCDTAQIKVTVGKYYGKLPEATKQAIIIWHPVAYTIYYKFEGWYTEPNGKGERITENTKVTTKTNHTLYAYFTSYR